MSYVGQGFAQAAPNKMESLAEETNRLLQRLREVHDRLENMGNRLVGSEPRPADAAVSPPLDSIARGVREAHGLVNAIDNELQRIDARL